MTPIRIGRREIGGDAPCFIVAEAGVNHDGRVALARRLVDIAAIAGCDAVKFQTFTADRLAVASAPKAAYQRASGHESQQEMLRRLELSEADHRDVIAHCATRKITFLSSPFDEQSADLLETLGVQAFKVPSGELTNTPLLENLARRGRPLLISTGMATLTEVERAVRAVTDCGNHAIVLLHCTSSYPAAPEDANLRAMETLRATFDVPVGYSDHTLGIDVALAAVALGACVLEKHVTHDTDASGPDHKVSLDAERLRDLVARVRDVERALGNGRKEPAASERDVAAVARKSVVAVREIQAGSVITEDMLGIRRPGTGLPPEAREQILGRRARVAIAAGSLIAWDSLERQE